MTNKLEKQEPKSIEVAELEDTMLDIATGGAAQSSKGLNIDCDTTTNQGCNTVAGCGGKAS